MNRLEESYSKLLEEKRLAGEIHHWQFEPMALRLADRTTYTPDFMTLDKDGYISFIECKGFWHQAGRIKLKVAAENHPWFTFTAVQLKKKEWIYEQF
jgi:hypothetical protein